MPSPNRAQRKFPFQRVNSLGFVSNPHSPTYLLISMKHHVTYLGSVCHYWHHTLVKDFRLRHWENLVEKTSRSFPTASHPSWIRRMNSLSKFDLPNWTVCPRYRYIRVNNLKSRIPNLNRVKHIRHDLFVLSMSILRSIRWETRWRSSRIVLRSSIDFAMTMISSANRRWDGIALPTSIIEPFQTSTHNECCKMWGREQRNIFSCVCRYLIN